MSRLSKDLVNNRDYILIAKKEIANANYQAILSDLKFCLKGIKKVPGTFLQTTAR